MEKIPEQFIQDPRKADKCRIIDAYGNIRNATISECRDLERASIWESSHVIERINDYYIGTPNKWVELLKVKEE